jgi:hypothetical protein
MRTALLFSDHLAKKPHAIGGSTHKRKSEEVGMIHDQ